MAAPRWTRWRDNQEDIRANQRSINDLDKWRAVVEAKMFTAADGLELQRQIAMVLAKIPDSYPPTTWVESVYKRDLAESARRSFELQESLKDINARLMSIDNALRDHALNDPSKPVPLPNSAPKLN